MASHYEINNTPSQFVWVAFARSSAQFTSDLVAFDDDWCEYDDENDESVSVQEIEFQWVLLKK